ncbi:hypothetical protein BCR34DRAFT_371206 [Clohesyomyces aquaticus]|uniref:Uncharacterized protein n=1 Tax=Clohesyomyces aquaticus TaxID=1231657 RepID=A0A1Y1ZGP6_9PLEO|nr:hypothetical protein BCR34DRAFT_371206 [Clohesyomyces aquaticus]
MPPQPFPEELSRPLCIDLPSTIQVQNPGLHTTGPFQKHQKPPSATSRVSKTQSIHQHAQSDISSPRSTDLAEFPSAFQPSVTSAPFLRPATQRPPSRTCPSITARLVYTQPKTSQHSPARLSTTS